MKENLLKYDLSNFYFHEQDIVFIDIYVKIAKMFLLYLCQYKESFWSELREVISSRRLINNYNHYRLGYR